MTTQAFVKANKPTNQPENDNPTKANPAVAHFSRFPVGSTEDEHMCELEETCVFSCSVGKLCFHTQSDLRYENILFSVWSNVFALT